MGAKLRSSKLSAQPSSLLIYIRTLLPCYLQSTAEVTGNHLGCHPHLPEVWNPLGATNAEMTAMPPIRVPIACSACNSRSTQPRGSGVSHKFFSAMMASFLKIFTTELLVWATLLSWTVSLPASQHPKLPYRGDCHRSKRQASIQDGRKG